MKLSALLLITLLFFSGCAGTCVINGRCTNVSNTSCAESGGVWQWGEGCNAKANNAEDDLYNHYQDPFPR